MNFFIPMSRASREGQATEENTTVSSASRFTAIGSEVSFPSGTSSPQHSSTFSAPSYSDTLEMYPDLGLLTAAADQANIGHVELLPTLRGPRSVTFRRDAVVLGIAHVLRRACMGRLSLSDNQTCAV